MDGRGALIKRLRSVIAIVLVAMYIAGLIAMLASSVQLALILWVVSTLGGIGLLYWIHTLKKHQEAEAKASADDAKDGQNPCA